VNLSSQRERYVGADSVNFVLFDIDLASLAILFQKFVPLLPDKFIIGRKLSDAK
jgi:hypothetical protein